MPSFPISGNLPGLNGYVVYVSPLGNDNNDGSSWERACKTGYVGYAKIVLAGGGTLYIANRSSWGGPVAGQGCWLRGDGATIPGWQSMVPCNIVGVGGGAQQNLFTRPGQIYLKCGSNAANDYRTKPGIWLATSDVNPVQFFNIRPMASDGYGGNADGPTVGLHDLFRPWRIGWDYPRKTDGTILYLPITNSNRAAGSTVHTVTLPAGIVATHASRVGNVTTLTIPVPAGAEKFPPYGSGTKFWLASNDEANFPSGAYSVLSTLAVVGDTHIWDLKYTDVAANHETDNPGSVKSIVTQSGEFIDLETNSGEFPSTQYEVTATSITNSTTGTITVTDLWGGSNGVNATKNSNTIVGYTAQLAHQERGFGQVFGPALYNCTQAMPQPTNQVAIYQSGPGFDFGGINAIPAIMDSCFVAGYFPAFGSGIPYDKNRMVAVFCYGGRQAQSNLITKFCTGVQACLRYISSSFNGLIEIDLVGDSENNGQSPPIYSIDGSIDLRVNIVNAVSADSATGFGLPEMNGSFDPLLVDGEVPISSVGPSKNGIGRTRSWVTGDVTDNPWVDLKVGTWADLRTTGKHPAGNRQISPTMARFTNIVTVPGSWQLTNATLTTIGIPDPMGGTGAVRITSGGAPSIIKLFSGIDTVNSFAAGGRYVIAGWVNFPSLASVNLSVLFQFNGSGDAVWKGSGTAAFFSQCPAALKGWQYVVISDKLTSGSASQTYDIVIGGPPINTDHMDVFGLSAFWIPASVDQNDACEMIGTLRAQPQYLKPGMAGTFENQKFIGHGGIGTDSTNKKTVGVGSGQLTLTGSGTVYLPMYDKDGTTIIGWVAQLQATVNP